MLDVSVSIEDDDNFGLIRDFVTQTASDLPDMHAQIPRATGPRAKGIHIRQITSAYVTTNT